CLNRSLATFLILILASTAAKSEDTVSSPLIITLRPAAADSEKRVPYVNITLTYAIPQIAAGQPLLRLPLIIANVVTVAQTIEALSVNDANGPVGVSVRDDGDAGQVTYRNWI